MAVVISGNVKSEVSWDKLESVNLGFNFSSGKFDIDHSSSSGDRVSGIDVEPFGQFSSDNKFVIRSHGVVFWSISIRVGSEVKFLDSIIGCNEAN